MLGVASALTVTTSTGVVLVDGECSSCALILSPNSPALVPRRDTAELVPTEAEVNFVGGCGTVRQVGALLCESSVSWHVGGVIGAGPGLCRATSPLPSTSDSAGDRARRRGV